MVDPTKTEVTSEWGIKISVGYDLIYTTSLETLVESSKESWADWICRVRNVQLVKNAEQIQALPVNLK